MKYEPNFQTNEFALKPNVSYSYYITNRLYDIYIE